MKTQGFIYKHMTLSKAVEEGITLPPQLGVWGSIENFSILEDKHLTPKVFLLYYFDEIIAGLLYLEKSFYFMKVGYSPHPNQSVPYAHIYMKPQDSQRAYEQLLEKFITELSLMVKKEFVSFTLVLPPEFEDVREFIWNKWNIEPRYTYYMAFQEVQKVGFPSYVGKKIRNIIKNTKTDLNIKSISAAEFFTCYQQTYIRQHKKNPKTLHFFEQLYSLKNVHFYGAFKEEILTSGVIICEVGDSAYYITSGTLDSYHNSNGVTHLIYDYIEKIIANELTPQIKLFDFAGANTKNVAHFKTNFQPKLKRYYRVSRTRLSIKFLKTLLNKE